MRVHEDRVIRPGGGKGIFGIIKMLPGSTVVPLDEDMNVILTSEFKYGAGFESIEVVSGGISAQESPLDAGKRELQEEIGVSAQKWTDLGFIDPFPTVFPAGTFFFGSRSATS